jgi:hypothetical protein
VSCHDVLHRTWILKGFFGMILWTRQLTFGFCKWLGISWLGWLVECQEGLLLLIFLTWNTDVVSRNKGCLVGIFYNMFRSIQRDHLQVIHISELLRTVTQLWVVSIYMISRFTINLFLLRGNWSVLLAILIYIYIYIYIYTHTHTLEDGPYRPNM